MTDTLQSIENEIRSSADYFEQFGNELLTGFADRLQALSEALGGWLPIESCPGGEVLLYYPPITEGRNQKREWITIGYNHSPRKASHWMPKPPPPTIANGSEVEGG